ncbi:hypothetical protein DP939_25270 [Spongiactinospora rosea]|uniref:NlpC/P60 domain-containing protein n=1 Tax=Spongiactinospora rosea TaxID=2248750 RepID=A0A366LV77_9ACTN|nr:C40 family peptidase [Spongiactinospora rosea]RBQ17259.1 hypothetical protein DP939_25270 [Spongiactinospora rosea]
MIGKTAIGITVIFFGLITVIGAAGGATLPPPEMPDRRERSDPRRSPAPKTSPPEVPEGGTAAGRKAVQAALRWLGTPYSWGGGGPGGPSRGICCSPGGHDGRKTVGFDCSGLTEYAWAQAGARIGSTTVPQWRAGPRIHTSDRLRPGDLVFFGGGSGEPTHVGLYISNGTMVHAPRTGSVVHTVNFSRSGYYTLRYRGAVRPRTNDR